MRSSESLFASHLPNYFRYFGTEHTFICPVCSSTCMCYYLFIFVRFCNVLIFWLWPRLISNVLFSRIKDMPFSCVDWSSFYIEIIHHPVPNFELGLSADKTVALASYFLIRVYFSLKGVIEVRAELLIIDHARRVF